MIHRAPERLVGVHESRLPERHPLRRSLRDRADRVCELERAPGRSRGSERRRRRRSTPCSTRRSARSRTAAASSTSSSSAGTRSSRSRGSTTSRSTAATRRATRRRSTGRASSSPRCSAATSSPTIRTATSTRVPFLDRQLHIPDARRRPPAESPTRDRRDAQPLHRPSTGRLDPADRGDDRLRLPQRRRRAGRRGAAGAARRAGANPPGLIGDTWTQAEPHGRIPARRHPPSTHVDQRPRRPSRPAAARPGRRCSTSPTCRPRPAGLASRTTELVFSMGCHAGLSVSDVFVVSPLGTARLAAGIRAAGRGAYAAQHRLRLRRQPRRRLLGRAPPALRREPRRLRGSRRPLGNALVLRSRTTSASSASSASTTRSRWPSSRSTGCRCGR